MRVPVTLLLLGAVAAAEPVAESIDRATAARIVAIGDRAAKAGQHATARRLFERALALDADQPNARARLGYRRSGKEWKQPDPPPPVADRNPETTAPFLRDLRSEEERRAEAYLRAKLTDHYLELLTRLPRNEALHKALGHVGVGSRYARPELVAAARKYDEQRKRWQEIAAPTNVAADGEPANIPGIGVRPAFRAEGLRIAGTIPDADLREVARTLPAPRAFLRELFGADVWVWTPPIVVFVTPEDYRRSIETLFPPGDERDAELRKITHRGRDMVICRTYNAEHGRDSHSHSVGFHSASWWCTPGEGNERDWHAYAWFREGMGYFAAMEVAGTGITYYYSTSESSQKIPPTVPPPKRRVRSELLPWLQGQILDGTTDPLPDLLGRSLNNIDLLLSLEAWSFVEFLAAYDPEGLRRLPAALRAETEGAYRLRADRALAACLGKGVAELEPLWRAFVLEIM